MLTQNTTTETNKGLVGQPATADARGVPFDEGELREAIRKATQFLTPTQTLAKTQSNSTPPITKPDPIANPGPAA
eukprot:12907415-Prorocentrum_lima.AAC.1